MVRFCLCTIFSTWEKEIKPSAAGRSRGRPRKWASRREMMKARSERYRALVDYAKSSGCLVCGERELVALDMHHLGDKEFSLGSIAARCSISVARVEAEIAKCVVLCANCHRKLHAGVITLAHLQVA